MKKTYKIMVGILSFIAFGILLELSTMYFLNMNLHQIFYPSSYKISFPENKFPVKMSQQADYSEKVNIGYEQMKTERVIFAGLGRNIEKALPATIERLEKTGSLFKDYRVVVFENDSNDATRDMLKEWVKSNNKIILVECPEVPDCKFMDKQMYEYGPLSKTRMEKMANFRNRYLSVIEKQFSDFDYAIILDIDLQGPWSNNGIAHTIAHKEWDGVFAYGLHSLVGSFGTSFMMYDGLAYIGHNDPYDSSKKIVKNYIMMNFIDLWNIQKGDSFVPVKSSFSGLAIYKMKSLLGSTYNADWPCEHIGLHEEMIEKGQGRFYINPSLLLLSGNQGSPNIFNYLL